MSGFDGGDGSMNGLEYDSAEGVSDNVCDAEETAASGFEGDAASYEFAEPGATIELGPDATVGYEGHSQILMTGDCFPSDNEALCNAERDISHLNGWLLDKGIDAHAGISSLSLSGETEDYVGAFNPETHEVEFQNMNDLMNRATVMHEGCHAAAYSSEITIPIDGARFDEIMTSGLYSKTTHHDGSFTSVEEHGLMLDEGCTTMLSKDVLADMGAPAGVESAEYSFAEQVARDMRDSVEEGVVERAYFEGEIASFREAFDAVHGERAFERVSDLVDEFAACKTTAEQVRVQREVEAIFKGR